MPRRHHSPLRRLALAITLILPVVTVIAATPSPVEAAEVRDIVLPVPLSTVGAGSEGGVYWSDTYGACRSGCTRLHQGVDMLGPKMTPLLAAADGVISWMRVDAGRGNNLVITDDQGWSYHYIHINNDTPGTDDGANPIEHAFPPEIAAAWENGTWRGLRVDAGDVVAYMGDSGNAEACCSHLHFEITRPNDSNINPTPSVDAALARAEAGEIEVPQEHLGPYESFGDLAVDLVSSLQGGTLSQAEAQAIADSLVVNGFAETVADYIGIDSRSATVDRLYVAYFLRLPDADGHRYWLDVLDGGTTIGEIGDSFAAGEEYQTRYDGLEFGDFLDQLYLDVLDRDPDEEGKAYWLDALENEASVTIGTIVTFFTEGEELRNLTRTRSEIVGLTVLLEDRMPTDEEIDAWAALRSTTELVAAIEATFLAS